MPKQVWQAEDGTQFENEKDCLLYERFSKELCKRAIPQEIRNLPLVQQGMHATAMENLQLADYNESKPRHFHMLLEEWINRP